MQDRSIRLPILGEPEAGDRLRRAPAWLQMGFRPFFLAAALHAAIAVPWWLHAMTAPAAAAPGDWPPAWWHAHEMLFGFTLAVIAGFLLTAVRNWTGRDTAHGGALAGLLALWAAGRAAMAAQAVLPPLAVALAELAFPAVLIAVLARPVVATRNWRNLGVVGVLTVLFGCDALVHARFAAGDAAGARAALLAAVHFVVLLNVVVGGRVIGMFTWVATGRGKARRAPALDAAAIGASAATALAVVFAAPDALLAACAGFAAVANLLRLATWFARGVLHIPMVLILHVGYAWIAIGQGLLAASRAGWSLAEPTALHALTIGVIGTMTLGMMARVALGHTGRPVNTKPAVTAAFTLMFAAPIVRLSALMLPPEAWRDTVQISGVLFALAFLIYLLTFAPILLAPRPDGRAG